MTGLIQHTIDTPYLVGPVHCYSGEIEGELVLFDTGPPTPETSRYLRENIDLGRLKHVFITHCHIDHYGQTAWLEEHSDAVVYLPYRDCLKIDRHDDRIAGMYTLLKGFGFAESYLHEFRKIFESGVLFPPLPTKYRVAEKDIPGHLGIQIIPCPGHSQSDLVYAGEGWAVTGDTLLKGIFQSPLLDLDLEAGARFNNYEAYCATLLGLAELETKHILPGHRKSVSSVLATLQFYISKFLVRAEQLQPFQNEEKLPDLIDRLLGGRMKDVFHIYLKSSEIIFMKDFLARPELLYASLEKIGLMDSLGKLFDRTLSTNGSMS